MDRTLASILAREQRAYLARRRGAWGGHLEAARAFLGQGLKEAQGPALVLGAGSGLEVPWALAPPGTVGWDADPWSRILTFLRHRRWAPWVFQDLTGGMEALRTTALRTARQPWSGRVRVTRAASRRLAGLLGSLDPAAGSLRAWIAEHRPATILSANVMGQFGVLAQRAVEEAFRGASPWNDEEDPLDAALRAWTARAVAAFLEVLAESGADLWLLHDRGVLFGEAPFRLGPLAEPWTSQLEADLPLEAEDPLCGVDVAGAFRGRSVEGHQRWVWPVAPGQVHVMEALRIRPAAMVLGRVPGA